MNTVTPTSKREWLASLDIEIAARDGQSVLRRAHHNGPLRVQKPYRQPDGSLHVYILHPPGGVVGGDELQVDIDCGRGTRTLFTSPSAGKFYRCLPDLDQRQVVRIHAGENAHVEWLPQETIFFNGARAGLETRVQLAPTASFIGWDIQYLGRSASGEQFTEGTMEQRTKVNQAERLVHRETLRFSNDLAGASWGLSGCHVVGTLVAVPPGDTDIRGESLTDALKRCVAGPAWGVTVRGCTLLVRYLGSDAEECRMGFESARRCIGETGLFADRHLSGTPRIWNT